jgi:uncharacterized protein YggE
MRPLRLLPLLTVSLAVFTLCASAQTIQINQQNKTVAINTTDEATATADIAAITIGFEIFKPDAESATAEAGSLSHAIMEALHKGGVEDKNIESRNQYVSRNQQFDEKEDAAHRAMRQFRAEQSWVVSVSPENAAAVLRLAQDAGANQSGNVEWRLSNRKELQAKAAANALVKARAVAAEMADGLHVKLGMLIYASNEAPDVHINFPVPHRGGVGYGGGGGFGGGVAAQEVRILEIRPQTIREEATVYAVFAIE